MNAGLDSAAIVRAFDKLGVALSIKEEFDVTSDVVNGMHTFVFTTRTPQRELRVSMTELYVTLIVEDEGGLHRCLRGFKTSSRASFETLVERIKGMPEIIAALKGGPIIDTPIDWDGYR